MRTAALLTIENYPKTVNALAVIGWAGFLLGMLISIQVNDEGMAGLFVLAAVGCFSGGIWFSAMVFLHRDRQLITAKSFAVGGLACVAGLIVFLLFGFGVFSLG